MQSKFESYIHYPPLIVFTHTQFQIMYTQLNPIPMCETGFSNLMDCDFNLALIMCITA